MKNNDINSYKDSKIFYIINKILYKNVGRKCQFLYVSGPGSSPSKVYMFKDEKNKMYAVKICNTNISRVSLYEEVKNVDFLKPFLKEHLPNIIYIGKYKNLEIMISECLGIDNFFSSYSLNKKPIQFYFNIWNSVLLEILNMWKNSKNYNYKPALNPRNNAERIKRIKTGVLNTKYNNYSINTITDLKIEVNGVEYLSLKETFDEIEKITEPDFGIICHGDPQPSNIIISENNNSWYLVDWEWSGENHDYRLMFSHLYGWWGTRLLNLENFPIFKVENRKLVINYEIISNKEITRFQNMSFDMLKREFKLKSKDFDDINRFLALLYLGDIRFLDIWGRLDYLPVLIGEAVKTVSYIKNNRLSINNNFTVVGGDGND